ncbi:Uncharacterized protein TCAP_05825 [Tolypocladium capitatum]|uniref:Uncharacterized protein n=1 Tax=Tolypocladium capitatum TaxID=45235 RepID=A0A2K3Q9K7_9HYPO|nr:Uncharacterized protein TCAP_05825 [Tolypocladium capitatum]
MDTIGNMANEAAKVVWEDGEERKEPVSGAAADVSKGEPYDTRNLETSDQNKPEKKMSGDERTSADTTSFDASASASASGGKSSGGDDEGDPDSKVMGAGPKPIATVANEHGGDAGNRNETSKGVADKSAAAANRAGDSHDSSDNKGREGMGEQYVRTTGFAADGGNFDATWPGAGREADREFFLQKPDVYILGIGFTDMRRSTGLLEQKAVHHEGDPVKDTHKDKPSLGDRIKNKLHRH